MALLLLLIISMTVLCSVRAVGSWAEAAGGKLMAGTDLLMMQQVVVGPTVVKRICLVTAAVATVVATAVVMATTVVTTANIVTAVQGEAGRVQQLLVTMARVMTVVHLQQMVELMLL